MKFTGYLPPGELATEQRDRHEMIVAALPPFVIPAGAGPDVPSVILTRAWTHPRLVDALGFPFPGIHQLTPSCVGAGGGDTAMTCIALDVLERNDPERIVLPFWLYNYGQSRKRLNMRGQGGGSTGAAFNASLIEDGVTDGMADGLPKPVVKDGLEWGERVEYAWSDGFRIPVPSVVEAAKAHPVKATSQSLTSVEELKAAISLLAPCTFAHLYNVGSATVRGNPPVAIGTFDEYGPHQVSIQAWWDHPTEGLIFGQVNQWPAGVYPKDPAGLPRCSVWIPAGAIEKAFRARDRWGNPAVECYPLSGYEGWRTGPNPPPIPDSLIDWRS